MKGGKENRERVKAGRNEGGRRGEAGRREKEREGERRRGEEMTEWVKLPPAMRVTQRQMRKKTSNMR